MKILYSILDLKAGSYSPLFPADNDGVAQRMLIQTLTAPGAERTNLRQFPSDFDLRRVGSFDEFTGELLAIQFPVSVCSVSSVVLTLSSVPADAQPTQPQ